MVQPERRKGEAGAGNVRLRQLLGGLCSKRELRTGETAGCRRQEFFGFVFEGRNYSTEGESLMLRRERMVWPEVAFREQGAQGKL